MFFLQTRPKRCSFIWEDALPVYIIHLRLAGRSLFCRRGDCVQPSLCRLRVTLMILLTAVLHTWKYFDNFVHPSAAVWALLKVGSKDEPDTWKCLRSFIFCLLPYLSCNESEQLCTQQPGPVLSSPLGEEVSCDGDLIRGSSWRIYHQWDFDSKMKWTNVRPDKWPQCTLLTEFW